MTNNFNPRSREGSDKKIMDIIHSTGDFNPRSREGSDANSRPVCRDISISIHAPVKGATVCEDFWVVRLEFQSTLP